MKRMTNDGSFLIFSREIRPWRAKAFGEGGRQKTLNFSTF
jgi:hypothetical protein